MPEDDAPAADDKTPDPRRLGLPPIVSEYRKLGLKNVDSFAGLDVGKIMPTTEILGALRGLDLSRMVPQIGLAGPQAAVPTR